MQLGRVIGTVVATIRYEGLAGIKFLIVQPLDRQSEPKGEPVVAADGVAMAGPGERGGGYRRRVDVVGLVEPAPRSLFSQ